MVPGAAAHPQGHPCAPGAMVNLLSDLFFKPRSLEKSQEYSSKLAYIYRPLANTSFIHKPDGAR